MKTIILGDIHGRTIWKDIIDKEEIFDKIIFIGDYFDSEKYTTDEQLINFENIIKFKKNSTEVAVILLVGNHDIHYFPEIGDCSISRYQKERAKEIEAIIDLNRDHLQIAYQYGKYLFSHAGVSSDFLDNVFEVGNWQVLGLAEKLNKLFISRPESFLFNGVDPAGNDITQTPIWIRPESLIKANFNTLREKVIQIFGHTKIENIEDFSKITRNRYFLIDTLGTSGQYLVIEDGKIKITYKWGNNIS